MWGGIWGPILLIAVEYLGIPLPTELSYIAGYQMAKSGRISFIVLFLAIMAAHFVGTLIAYKIGYQASVIATKKQRLEGVQKKLASWYAQYGPVTIVATQLIGHVRPWSSYIAGFSRVRLLPFMLYSMVGSAILTIIMLVFAETIVHIWHAYPLVRGLLIGGFLAIIILAAYFWVSKWRRKSLTIHESERRGKTTTARTTRRQ
jgi:membrane protein DedA with SNARE-associated domain